MPSKNFAQLRIFNTLNCSIEGKLQDENELSQELSFIIKSMNMWENKYIKANGQKNFNYLVNFTTCNEAGITNISQSEIKGMFINNFTKNYLRIPKLFEIIFIFLSYLIFGSRF